MFDQEKKERTMWGGVREEDEVGRILNPDPLLPDQKFEIRVCSFNDPAGLLIKMEWKSGI